MDVLFVHYFVLLNCNILILISFRRQCRIILGVRIHAYSSYVFLLSVHDFIPCSKDVNKTVSSNFRILVFIFRVF
mgnify:CR=1 FL=1